MELSDEDTYVDVLKDRRESSDLCWVTRTLNSPSCKYSMGRSPEQIKLEVLNSERIQSLIKEISVKERCPEKDVLDKAVCIIEEMAHDYQLKAIRLFGLILSKLMKRLYGSVFVNTKQLDNIRELSEHYPMLFLPTHRSYADFLLVSYVCFHFDLPIPVIAAGLDFLGLKAVSSLLRSSGAFFIRRSFVHDRLYWDIFTQYVQSHIEGCEYPLEFFIEGTRSRTAKSLVPKLGMLQVSLEMFFTSRVPDIIIVPISISYDRTLEETLYAFELLGVPKPKESTSGLFKARKVLNDYFGNVHLNFGEPLSVKSMFENYSRSLHNLHPRTMPITLKMEQELCSAISRHIIIMHHKNLTLSPFPLMCLVLGHHAVLETHGIKLDDLLNQVIWLSTLIEKTGAKICWDNTTIERCIEEQLKLHSNIVDLSCDGIVSIRKFGTEQIISSSPQTLSLKVNTLKHALPEMHIYHYGNQALQLLVYFAMACLSIYAGEQYAESQNEAFCRYKVLRKLLSKEFVFEEEPRKDFLFAINVLEEEGIIDTEPVFCYNQNEESFRFLQSLLHCFLYTYQVICQHLSTVDDGMVFELLIHQCQAVVEKVISDYYTLDHKSLCLDIIKNCISYLVSQGAVCKIKMNGEVLYKPSHPHLTVVMSEIGMFMSSSDIWKSTVNVLRSKKNHL